MQRTYWTPAHGGHYKTDPERLLKPSLVGTFTKYKYVVFANNNYRKKFLVHRLVYEAFNGKIPEGYTIDHIDQNKLNNKIENLRWVTKSENRLNLDVKKYSENQRRGQLNSVKKKRVPIKLVNIKTKEEYTFNSRFQAGQWLIENGHTKTKSPKALARRMQLYKYLHGFNVYNINAERLTDKV